MIDLFYVVVTIFYVFDKISYAVSHLIARKVPCHLLAAMNRKYLHRIQSLLLSFMNVVLMSLLQLARFLYYHVSENLVS